MRVRLTQPGMQGYTGQMGVHFFENGLTTADVSNNDAMRIAAVYLAEWEDGTPANMAQKLLDAAHDPAPVYEQGAAEHDRQAKALAMVATMESDKPQTSLYTREQLAAIADKDGIRGLRAIAEPLEVKGNSIRELIEKIMLRQQPRPDQPDFS
jgi:hypothetical protein